MLAVAEMLHGDHNERTQRFGFVGLSTFGLLKDRPSESEWVLALLRSLLSPRVGSTSTPTDHPVPLAHHEIGRAGDARAMPWHIIMLPKEKAEGEDKLPSRRTRDRRRCQPGPDGRACFERLQNPTARTSRGQRRLSPYVVALDRTLIELATRRPPRWRELSRGVHGMGPVRIEPVQGGVSRCAAGRR